jgi:hypothetical protein
MSDTPEDLERRRLQKRLVELRNQLAEISGGEHMFGPAGEGMTLEMEVAFLEQIVAFETAPETSWLDRLSESGYDMPDPATLSDAEIGLEVWQVIQRLSELRVYLSSTNHLSDRQLYEHLYQDSLREVTQHMPDNPDTACHIDILGGCSDADLKLWLRYYADDQERADWRERFPDFVVPQREKPPFVRDHLLPERAYEASPLSEYLNRLASTEWDDPKSPVHLAADLTHDELAGTEIYQTARALLEGLRETGRAKATAKSGHLCRAFVKQLHPGLPLRKELREAHEKHYKVISESDLPVLHKVRLAVQDSGLIKKQKGFFSLTRKGQSLLEPSRSGELFRTLFTTLFRKIDLAYFDFYADLPILQGTLPISLWRLGIVAREWMELEELVMQTLLPEAVDALELERREYLPPGLILDTRLWRHLAEFGLLESNRTSPDPNNDPRGYRITPLFDRFLSFDPLEMP